MADCPTCGKPVVYVRHRSMGTFPVDPEPSLSGTWKPVGRLDDGVEVVWRTDGEGFRRHDFHRNLWRWEPDGQSAPPERFGPVTIG